MGVRVSGGPPGTAVPPHILHRGPPGLGAVCGGLFPSWPCPPIQVVFRLLPTCSHKGPPPWWAPGRVVNTQPLPAPPRPGHSPPLQRTHPLPRLRLLLGSCGPPIPPLCPSPPLPEAPTPRAQLPQLGASPPPSPAGLSLLLQRGADQRGLSHQAGPLTSATNHGHWAPGCLGAQRPAASAPRSGEAGRSFSCDLFWGVGGAHPEIRVPPTVPE